MGKIIQIFKRKDVRNKVLFTLFILVLYRLGCAIPVPGIPFHQFADAFQQTAGAEGAALAVLDMFSGNALSRFSLFSLGIMPYITASIIMQLMTAVIPKVAQWRKEGGEGRRQIVKWTRYLTIAIGLVNAFGFLMLFKSEQYGISFNPSVPPLLSDVMVMFALLAGVILIMWLGELITNRGIGNGMSVIIFANVVSSIPSALYQSITLAGTADMSGTALTVMYMLLILVLIPLMVFVERAQRRIPIKSSKAGANSRYARRKESSYIPLKVNAAGVIAIIFASCLTVGVNQLAIIVNVEWMTQFANFVSNGVPSYVIQFMLIIFFVFFYINIEYNFDDIAENLKKSGSFIPGIRPGQATSDYLHDVITKINVPGALYVAIIAVGSSVLMGMTAASALVSAFGGTAIFIMVSVGIDICSRTGSLVKASDPSEVLKKLG